MNAAGNSFTYGKEVEKAMREREYQDELIYKEKGKKYGRGIAGEIMIYKCNMCGATSSALGSTDERMDHLEYIHNVKTLRLRQMLTMTAFSEWRSCEIYEDD